VLDLLGALLFHALDLLGLLAFAWQSFVDGAWHNGWFKSSAERSVEDGPILRRN
jgi:hypothetical protein